MGADDIQTRLALSPSHQEADSRPSYRHMPLWRIITCTIAMCGVQVCYSAQINLGTAELLLLGISERAVSFAWLAGPLSGLVMQPIVGCASDSCTSPLGRRRPFLIAGSILTSVALLIFSNAVPIAKFLTSDTLAPKAALPLAICAFFLLDFSVQAVQAPLRALVTDVIPKPQRALANSYIGVFAGLGVFLGGFLTSLNLKLLFPFFQTDIQALFAIASLVLTVTVAVCVVSTPEEPLGPAGPYEPVSSAPAEESISATRDEERNRSSRGVWDAIHLVPRPFWRVFAVQLCTWCGFFALFVYVNSWVGRNVFMGDGTAEPGSEARKTFERGVKFGGKGNALMSIVMLIYSLSLPQLLRSFGVIPVYAISQFVEAACLLSGPLIRGTSGQVNPSQGLRVVTLLDIGMFGIVWATTMGVPWTLIGDALESDAWYAQRIGLFQTLFNASQSFPQLFIAAVVAPVVLSVTSNDPAYVMFAGGVFAAIGAILVLVLRVDIFGNQKLVTHKDASLEAG